MFQTLIRKGFLPLFLLFQTIAFSQILNPVHWETELNKISETEYELIFHAEIEPHWHLYATEMPAEGPNPTTFTFEAAGEDYELVGGVTQSEPEVEYDQVFEMDLAYFSGFEASLFRPDLG